MKQMLQQEWAYNKYLVMAHSQKEYLEIRKLFAKQMPENIRKETFDSHLKRALLTLPTEGSLINTYQHIWGYFKKQATPDEKDLFRHYLAHFDSEQVALHSFLKQLAIKYNSDYLLKSNFLFPDN